MMGSLPEMRWSGKSRRNSVCLRLLTRWWKNAEDTDTIFLRALIDGKNTKDRSRFIFLCEFTGEDSQIDLDTPHPEFRAWKWIDPRDFDLNWVVEFKRGVYANVLRDFFEIV